MQHLNGYELALDWWYQKLNLDKVYLDSIVRIYSSFLITKIQELFKHIKWVLN